VSEPPLFYRGRSGCPRLSYVSDAALSIQRLSRGKEFSYRNHVRAIHEAKTLKRIKGLAIPPAWADVRICQKANGHIQAVGRDARGRKQYIYHPAWREFRDRQKYAHLLDFARVLPRIRRRVSRDLGQVRITRTKVLAALVRLLERSRIRVGNEEYARNNHSFGLTTMRVRHVRINGAKLRFEYLGKSGVRHAVELYDPGLARVVARCQEIPGQELFQYRDEDGHRRRIKSGDVNQYLREISGGDFTAKDFRTWAGTIAMAKALRDSRERVSATQARANVQRAFKTVAAHLGNTPAICRKCYVHPAVIDDYLEGCHAESANGGRHRNGGGGKVFARRHGAAGLRAEEAVVFRLLQEHQVAARSGSAPRRSRSSPSAPRPSRKR
jgi:DNA topoisomerase-1